MGLVGGPWTPAEAKRWVCEAMANSRYTPSVHFRRRMVERGVTFDSVMWILRRPARVEPYPRPSPNGGSCWRFFGRDLHRARNLAVGLDAFLDAEGKAAILCTVIDLEGGRC